MAAGPTFNTPSGSVTGHQPRDDVPVYRFQSIPYATAERFKPCIPIAPWTEPLLATTPCPACPQINDEVGEKIMARKLLQGLERTEHCLYLSVTLPMSVTPQSMAAPSFAKLPVMVFIHGGAYIYGAGDDALYDPSRLVAENNIIVVNVTYRLGLFGYIGDGVSRPANLGLIDQHTALKWVRNNIEAFGGDGANITMAGQSAGADAVWHLLAVDGIETLVRRAISQSSPFGIMHNREKLLDALLKESQDLSEKMTEEQVLEECHKCVQRAIRFGLTGGGMPFTPQYGQAPLPDESQLEERWKKQAANIDILVGSNKDEVSPFVDVLPAVDAIMSIPFIGKRAKAMTVGHFTRKVYEDDANRVADMLARAGGNAWLYQIHWGPVERYKAAHSVEIALLFGHRDTWANCLFTQGITWEEMDRSGARLRKMWADFVKGSHLEKKEDIKGLITYRKA